MSYQDQNFDFSFFFNNIDRAEEQSFGFENDFLRNNSYERSNLCELEKKPSYLEAPQESHFNLESKFDEKAQNCDQQYDFESQANDNQNCLAETTNIPLSHSDSMFFFDFSKNQLDVQQQLPVIDETGFDYNEKTQVQTKSTKITIYIEIDDDLLPTSASSNNKHEESLSVTTKENSENQSTEKDQFDFQTEVKVGDKNFNLCLEWKSQILNYVRSRSEDEKSYVNEIMPTLLEALNEAVSIYNPTMSNTILESVVKELIHGKEYMIKTENKYLKQLIGQEIDEIRTYCPKNMIEVEDLYESKRKGKKSIKGNINHSSLNHMNENYVSNIFQFSKQNYQEDKELQRIANTRNVSATNFKKLTKVNLSDGVMVRKAKVRILASGKELINNVEYWMNDGYFNQCNDKEKYIVHKGKAASDLALE